MTVPTVPMRYSTMWTPFDDEMRDAMLRPTPGPVYYDGPEVEAFEAEMAAYLGVRCAVGVASGSAALHVAMLALGIGPGDEVIVPAAAYLAAAECTLQVGARPVYCDVRADTANIDVASVAPCVTPRTKAVVAVHTYGHPVDMDPLLSFARTRGLFVIEDAAHALGARYHGRKAGALSDVAFASFARKGVTVAGQGGMALTNDASVARSMGQLRRHGWDPGSAYRAQVGAVGFDYTLSESLAAVGRVSLRRLDAYNAARAANAARYTAGFAARGIPARPLAVMPWATHAWLHYVVRAPRRDALIAFLRERGIAAGIHYEHLVYRMPAYVARTGDPGPRPVTDALTAEILTLPSHPDVGQGIDEILDAIAEFYTGLGASAIDPTHPA